MNFQIPSEDRERLDPLARSNELGFMMIVKKYPGKFIVFEGLDGSGSSTQAGLLVNYLNAIGKKAYLTKEPTNNLVGGLIRGLLTKDWSTSPEGFQLLFSADRAHHLVREVIPILEKGGIVISDRYAFSTIAFGSLDLDSKWLAELNKYFLLPDITFLLKVRPEKCIERIGKTRASREFFEETEKLKKVWRTYQKLANDKKNKIVLLDGEKPIEEIAEKVIKLVGEIL